MKVTIGKINKTNSDIEGNFLDDLSAESRFLEAKKYVLLSLCREFDKERAVLPELRGRIFFLRRARKINEHRKNGRIFCWGNAFFRYHFLSSAFDLFNSVSICRASRNNPAAFGYGFSAGWNDCGFVFES
jgi:hypothetical protein